MALNQVGVLGPGQADPTRSHGGCCTPACSSSSMSAGSGRPDPRARPGGATSPASATLLAGGLGMVLEPRPHRYAAGIVLGGHVEIHDRNLALDTRALPNRRGLAGSGRGERRQHRTAGPPARGPGRYARAEIERRWILSEAPDPPRRSPCAISSTATSRAPGCAFGSRSRRAGPRCGSSPRSCPTPSPATRGRQGLLTNTYLARRSTTCWRPCPPSSCARPATAWRRSASTCSRARWPASCWPRSSSPPRTRPTARRSPPPRWSRSAMTPAFTGGRLVRTGADELRSWLRELGVPFVPPPTTP